MNLSDIIVPERMRKLYENITALSLSIQRFGLLEPLLLSPDNVLIAGGRRLEAIKSLGLSTIPDDWVRHTDTIDPNVALEMEYEENAQRLDITWQEKVCAIERIHVMRAQRAAVAGDPWLQDHTGALVGLDQCNVSLALRVAKYVRSGDAEIIACVSMRDALALLLKRTSDEATKLLAAKVAQPTVAPSATTALEHVAEAELDLGDPRAGFLKYPKNPRSFCFNMDAIAFMDSLPDASVDHIYTDPPYAIDMDNLDQENQGMSGIETVRETHKVVENMELLNQFIKQANRIIKPTGFLVFWYDSIQQDYLYGLLEEYGFTYQRWPLVWCKPVAMNNQASCNWTKATEVCMVARKPAAKLVSPQPLNYCTYANDKNEYGVQHPFWKPLILHRWVMHGFVMPGQTVLDPFAGEGSIPIAVLDMCGNPVAVECDEIHYARLITRMASLCETQQ